jgi:hypothetical protein
MRQHPFATLIRHVPRRSSLLALVALACCSASSVLAQTRVEPAQPSAAVEQLTERLVVEDGDSRIDELRVGGVSRKISVTPKGGMPAYELEPGSLAAGQGSASRVWKIFGF